MQERITIRLIQERVAEHYGMTATLLCGSSTRRCLIEPRHLAMWLAYHLLGKSYAEIGQAFGKRDHTTVLNALNNADRWTCGQSPVQVWDSMAEHESGDKLGSYCGLNDSIIDLRGVLTCRHVTES